MKRTEMLQRVHDAHAKLIDALDGLTEEQATRVGLTSQWAIKDALAHIAAWEFEGVRVVSEIQQGTYQPQRFSKQIIDDFNREASESRRDRSMSEVRGEFDAAHREILRVLESLPDEVDEASPAYKFAEAATFRHHAHHAAQIEEWKRVMGDR